MIARINTSLKRLFVLAAPACMALSLVFSVVSAAQAAPIVWVPAGLNPGDQYQLAFVTSTKTGGASSIATYNAFVDGTMAPIDSGSPYASITWTAIASTTSANANVNAPVSAPVYDLLGNLIATGFADFWDGTHSGHIDTNELGATTPSGENVWTGTSAAGIAGGGFAPLGAVGLNTTGRPNQSANAGWINFSALTHNNSLSLYGLSEVLTVPVQASAVPEPSTYTLAVLGLLGLGCFALRENARQITISLRDDGGDVL